MTSDAAKVIQAGYDAQSLTEKLAPFLEELEREAMERALTASYWQPEGTRDARHALDDVKAVRSLRERLTTAIALGEMQQNKARTTAA